MALAIFMAVYVAAWTCGVTAGASCKVGQQCEGFLFNQIRKRPIWVVPLKTGILSSDALSVSSLELAMMPEMAMANPSLKDCGFLCGFCSNYFG